MLLSGIYPFIQLICITNIEVRTPILCISQCRIPFTSNVAKAFPHTLKAIDWETLCKYSSEIVYATKAMHNSSVELTLDEDKY